MMVYYCFYFIRQCNNNHSYTIYPRNSHICFDPVMAHEVILLSIFDDFGSYDKIIAFTFEISLSYPNLMTLQ
jgi:hypothetical protein